MICIGDKFTYFTANRSYSSSTELVDNGYDAATIDMQIMLNWSNRKENDND